LFNLFIDYVIGYIKKKEVVREVTILGLLFADVIAVGCFAING
jgi:ABC-type Mn2+/Zn2+ transport system permease subunit